MGSGIFVRDVPAYYIHLKKSPGLRRGIQELHSPAFLSGRSRRSYGGKCWFRPLIMSQLKVDSAGSSCQLTTDALSDIATP